ncbi:MAG: hypothetical protein GY801_02325 [bacterium]|nr:hypothetical protein [bacterium]
MIDITDRKHAEEELQRYREHLQELVEERTAEIIQVNKILQQEVMNRLEAQKALQAGKVRQTPHDLYSITREIYEGEFEIRTADDLSRIWDFSSAPLGKLADGGKRPSASA